MKKIYSVLIGLLLISQVAIGQVIVKNINPGTGHSYPNYLTDLNGTLIFIANDGTAGTELWKSNGTTASTSMIADINSGAGSAQP